MSNLPSPETIRWVKSKKLAVVKAIKRRAITPKQAEKMYMLSKEELDSWINLYEKHGQDALKTTYLQEYR